jgi:hypothetical protein
MTWLLIAIVVVVALANAWWRLRRGAARQRRLMLLCDHAGLAFEALDLHPTRPGCRSRFSAQLDTNGERALGSGRGLRRPGVRLLVPGRDRGAPPREPTTPHVHPGATGIVLFALGLKTTIAHVDESLAAEPAVALCGGLSLFLTHVGMRIRIVHHVRRTTTDRPGWIGPGRLAAAIGTLVLIPAALALPHWRRSRRWQRCVGR